MEEELNYPQETVEEVSANTDEPIGNIIERLQNQKLDDTDYHEKEQQSPEEKVVTDKKNDKSITDKETTEQEDKKELSFSLKEKEKLEEENKKTRSWANELSRKLKSYEQKVKKSVEEGLLDQDEAKELLNAVTHEAKENDANNNHPFYKYIKIFDEEIENIAKYGNEEDIEKKIKSFNLFLSEASQEELAEVHALLEDLVNDPILMTKKVLEIGKKHLEENYNELYETGSIRALKKKYKEELENNKKIIDKLERQLLKYKQENEDYVQTSGYKIPSGSNTRSNEDSSALENYYSTDAILKRTFG